MLRIKFKNQGSRQTLRQYSPSSLVSAYEMVKSSEMSVYGAAKRHGVPVSTLRDRVDNRINIETVKSGPMPVLSIEEESRLCCHLKECAELGYGYTRGELVAIASDYAVSLGRRDVDKPFSLQWYRNFMSRWPELKLVKPSSLSEKRAMAGRENVIVKYFEELTRIFDKYGLREKPQNIYNIDEKGLNTEFRPPKVVAGSQCKAQAIMAERSKTVTVIGAGNAIGTQIPPFFVFPGERYLDSLLEGKTAGASGTMTKSGWSNSIVFRTYLEDHFMNFVQGRRDTNDPILVMYDGHKSHVSVDLVDWALSKNIILFVLPPHTSHILQPMDVGCFGPLQNKYNHECTAFARMHGRVVTRYDVCRLACKAYSVALSPANLQASFRRAGIFPLLDGASMCRQLGLAIRPSCLYEVSDEEELVTVAPSLEENVDGDSVSTDFFKKRSISKKEISKKMKRKNISSVIGGKALEGETVKKLKKYDTNKAPRKEEKKKSSAIKKSKKTVTSQEPGPSCIRSYSDDDFLSDLVESDVEGDGAVCCVCNHFYVPKEKTDGALFITQWAGCDLCDHWVHLKFCTSVRVARSGTSFLCPCCQ